MDVMDDYNIFRGVYCTLKQRGGKANRDDRIILKGVYLIFPCISRICGAFVIYIVQIKVKVSKNKAPVIHFVIHHQKLRDAIENFVPPMVEKN